MERKYSDSSPSQTLPPVYGDLDINELSEIINSAYISYGTSKDFVQNDPISIPHQYTKLQDIEIVGFWTAILSWGQRSTIIQKANELFALMDYAPYDFVCNYNDKDLKRFANFKHRTFQPPDTTYFLHFFKHYYQNHNSLETAFYSESDSLEDGINQFYEAFFPSCDRPTRTMKHISCPARKSTCKRINMFLRWMVRSGPIDFGLWTTIHPSMLYIPYDVHVQRVALALGIVENDKKNWQAVQQLTNFLRYLDPEDPVKYDLALFSMGLNKELNF